MKRNAVIQRIITSKNPRSGLLNAMAFELSIHIPIKIASAMSKANRIWEMKSEIFRMSESSPLSQRGRPMEVQANVARKTASRLSLSRSSYHDFFKGGTDASTNG